MGTRHLVTVKVDGKTRVAQYGQWDGYPTGQGHVIAEFIQKHLKLDKMKEKTRALKWIKDKELQDKWTEAGADPESSFVTFDISDKFNKMYPHLSRDTGAKVLRIIQDGIYTYEEMDNKHNHHKKTIKNIKVDKLINDSDFIKDGLFCEYAYEINLDKKTVTVIIPGYKRSTQKFTYAFKDFTKKAMTKLEKTLKARD